MGKLRLLMSEEITRRRGYYGEECPGYMLGWRDRDCVGIRVKSNAPTFNREIVLTANFPDLQYCTKPKFTTCVYLYQGAVQH